MPVQWTAAMISPVEDLDGAPLLRTEVGLDEGHGDVTEAQLHVSALGVFEATLNGTAVSDDVLSPGWSSYEWRLRYRSYDVGALLEDRTVLGLALGNGWYRGRLTWSGKRALYGDRLGAIAQLEITFADGHRQVVVTDDSWAAGPSDRGRERPLRRPDDRCPPPRRLVDAARVLRPRAGAASRSSTSTPASSRRTSGRRWSATRRCGRRRSGPRRPAARSSTSGRTSSAGCGSACGATRASRSPSGTPRCSSTASSASGRCAPPRRPTASSSAVATTSSSRRFTFHGFRYAEVEGWPGELSAEDLEAVVVHSDLRRTGFFECSDELLNQLHGNVVWGQRGNFLDVPTDCPQRDERLGWTGDIAVFAPTSAFLYDVDGFLRDWLVDLSLEQRAADGMVAYVVPDALKYAPIKEIRGEPDSTAIWSDAAVWVPWALWQAYGDTQRARAQFDSMAAHVRRVESQALPERAVGHRLPVR